MKQTERKGTLRNIKWQTLIGGSSGYWRFVIRSSNPRTGFICVKYIFTYFRNEPNLRQGIWVISGTMLAYENYQRQLQRARLFFSQSWYSYCCKKIRCLEQTILNCIIQLYAGRQMQRDGCRQWRLPLSETNQQFKTNLPSSLNS